MAQRKSAPKGRAKQPTINCLGLSRVIACMTFFSIEHA